MQKAKQNGYINIRVKREVHAQLVQLRGRLIAYYAKDFSLNDVIEQLLNFYERRRERNSELDTE